MQTGALRSEAVSDTDPQPTQWTQPKKGEPVEIPVPTRGAFEAFVRKVAGRRAGRKRPDETNQPREQSE
jgi:hypothetical protein